MRGSLLSTWESPLWLNLLALAVIPNVTTPVNYFSRRRGACTFLTRNCFLITFHRKFHKCVAEKYATYIFFTSTHLTKTNRTVSEALFVLRLVVLLHEPSVHIIKLLSQHVSLRVFSEWHVTCMAVPSLACLCPPSRGFVFSLVQGFAFALFSPLSVFPKILPPECDAGFVTPSFR